MEALDKLELKVNQLEQTVLSLVEKITGHESERVYNVQQVAKLLGISPAGVNFHIRSGNIIAKGKRCKKISQSALDNFLSTKTKTLK